MVLASSSGVLVGIFVSLAIALLFGVGDFYAGVLSKKYSPLDFFAAIYIFEIPVLLTFMIAFGTYGETKTNIGLFFLGFLGCGGFAFMLVGLSKGLVSVVMSLMGLFSLIVPAIFSIFIESASNLMVWVGVVFASIAIVCVSQAHHDQENDSTEEHKKKLRLSIVFGTAAGLLIGVYFTGLGSIDSQIVPKLFFLQLSGLFFGIYYFIKNGSARKFLKPNFLYLSLIAIAYQFGQGLFPLAVEKASLIAANIIVNLYPGVAIFLAAVLLKEKVSKMQNFGFSLAILGVVLVSIGAGS